MLRISPSTACRFAEKPGFSARFGPGGAVPPPRIAPFQRYSDLALLHVFDQLTERPGLLGQTPQRLRGPRHGFGGLP